MKNLYDVLKLPKNCTAEEIRNSFLKLSKEYHPDKNKCSDAHKKFVEINEAYSVLGKRHTRIRYDEENMREQNFRRRTGSTSSDFKVHNVYYNYDYMRNMQKNQPPRHSKSALLSFELILCFSVLVLFGVGLQAQVMFMQKQRRDHQNQVLSLLLKRVKERAKEIGKEQAILEAENGTNKRFSYAEIEKELIESKKKK